MRLHRALGAFQRSRDLRDGEILRVMEEDREALLLRKRGYEPPQPPFIFLELELRVERPIERNLFRACRGVLLSAEREAPGAKPARAHLPAAEPANHDEHPGPEGGI